MAGWKKTAKRTYNKGKKAYTYAKAHQTEARRALVLAKKVARMVNVEYKFYDYTTSQTPSSSGTIVNLFDPAQGDSATQRDGDSVKLMRVSGRINLDMHGSATTTSVRLILFRGKQENAVSYGVTDILQSASFVAPKAHHERFRSKILYDKTYSLVVGHNRTLNLNWNFKLFGHVQFVVNNTTIENGGLYMLLISDEATNVPTVTPYLRTSFTDN